MRRFWPKFGIARLMAFIVLIAIVFASLRFSSGPWAGIVLLLTAGVIGWAIMAVVYRRGRSRAFWRGFALFGGIYAGLTVQEWRPYNPYELDLPTTHVLRWMIPYLDPVMPPKGRAVAGAPAGFFAGLLRDPDTPNRYLWSILDQPISMPFRQETPLEDVLKHIRRSTARPGYVAGIPIDVDPLRVQENDITISSPITFEMEGVPLRTTLKLMLKQLDLTYRVEDGVVRIISLREGEHPNFEPDAFQRIGHYWFAWLAGLIGGGVGAYLHAAGGRTGRDEAAGV